MKNIYIALIALLFFNGVTGQVLTNYYLEPGTTNDEAILHTSFYSPQGAGYIDYMIEITGNVIDFSICYQLTSVNVETFDDQVFLIDLPINFPDITLNVGLYFWDQNLNACDYANVMDGGTITFDFPYLPTAKTFVPDDNFEGFFEHFDIGDDIANNDLVYTHRIVNIDRLQMRFLTDLQPLGLNRIEDLTGIEILNRLRELWFEDNLVSEFDATNHPNLNFLYSKQNPISSLDLSGNPNLERLWIGDDNLTELDVTQNMNLDNLNITSNSISELDLSQNSELNELYIYNTPITSLDLSSNNNLVHLHCLNSELSSLIVNSNVLEQIDCFDNQLSTIDLSSCPALVGLGVAGNPITDLDIRLNPELSGLAIISEVLTSLDLRNGHNESFEQLLVVNTQSTLSCISVDDPNLAPYVNWTVVVPNVIYSADCSLIGIDDFERPKHLLYPNPVHSVLSIQSQEPIKSFQLYDISGKLVFTSEEIVNQIDFSGLEEGIYLLNLTTDSGTIIEKILKE